MPIMRPTRNPVERIPELRERLRKAGRDPKSASVGIFFAPPKREALDTLAAAGVSRAIFGLPSEPREAVLPRLDAYAKGMRLGGDSPCSLGASSPSARGAPPRCRTSSP